MSDLGIDNPTTSMIFRLPLSLKEQLDKHAYEHKASTSYIVRLGIARVLGIPDEAAEMHGNRTNEDQTPTSKQERNTTRKRTARRIQRQLATLAPEILNELNSRNRSTNTNGS